MEGVGDEVVRAEETQTQIKYSFAKFTHLLTIKELSLLFVHTFRNIFENKTIN